MLRPAHTDALGRGTAAYARGDYVRAVAALSAPALRGDARAQALPSFMYENGFGVPQAYDAAADFYQPYKWLDLAAAQIRTRSDTEDENVRGRDKIIPRLMDADVCRSC